MCSLQQLVTAGNICIHGFSAVELTTCHSKETADFPNTTQGRAIEIQLNEGAEQRLRAGKTTISDEYASGHIEVSDDSPETLVRVSLFLRWWLNPEKAPNKLIQCFLI